VVPEDAAPAPREIDVSVVHPARAYEHWLGGKDNSAVDRATAGRVLDAKPGIPSENNPPEVAQAVRPTALATYVDNDPIVLAHARALLTSVASPAMFFDAGLRDVGTSLSRAAETLNFSQPATLLDLIPGGDGPWRMVASSMDAIPSGKLPGTVPPGPRRGGSAACQGGQALQPARSGPDAPACPGRGEPVPGRPRNRRTWAGAAALVAAGSRQSRNPSSGNAAVARKA
jgi:hypothetical protein